MNPDRIVIVQDVSDETLRNIVAHLEVSTTFEHFVYRESELDEVCRLVELVLEGSRDPTTAPQRARLQMIFEAAHDAHHLVADEKPAEAAARLREIL